MQFHGFGSGGSTGLPISELIMEWNGENTDLQSVRFHFFSPSGCEVNNWSWISACMPENEYLLCFFFSLALYIKGNDVTKLASMAKLKAGRLARELGDSCLQYWGGMGFTSDVLVSRFYRSVSVTWSEVNVLSELQWHLVIFESNRFGLHVFTLDYWQNEPCQFEIKCECR